jgi:5-methylcytosine-specific restriction protein A
MLLKAVLTKILQEYKTASGEKFANHPMAAFLRQELPEGIKQSLVDRNEFIVRGSAGQSNWARSPWAAIFDLQITDSAQRGYYPVYLFREDFSGVYLSLNQGMTEVRESYKSDAKEALRSRAKDFRARLGKIADNFDQLSIDLKPSSPSNDSAFYEAGNIVAKFYPTENIPEEATLKDDFHEILVLYKHLIYGDPTLTEIQNLEDDEQENKFFENPRDLRVHKRIERNRALAKQVKKIQGYVCKLCGFNYEEHYGEIGKEYIEAHHLEPISKLEGRRVERDPKKDFAVLCANCHRMIHRSEFVGDLEGFRRKYLHKKA